MRIVKSFFIAGMIFLFAVSGVFAQENNPSAIIRELSGTVELQHPGSATWEKAAQGQTLMQNTIISTGFKSSALINVGNSIINVRPLTRLSLTELSQRSGTETINANLQAGRVRVDVKAPVGSRASFNVQSPVATASIRGTVFEMSTYELRVIEGTVEYTSVFNAPLLIDASGYSYVDERTGQAVTAETGTAIRPDMPIANDSLSTFEVNIAQGGSGFKIITRTEYKD